MTFNLQVNSVDTSEEAIQICTDQELKVLCLRAKIFKQSQTAAKTIEGTSKLDRGLWIQNHFEDGEIKDFICGQEDLNNLC